MIYDRSISTRREERWKGEEEGLKGDCQVPYDLHGPPMLVGSAPLAFNIALHLKYRKETDCEMSLQASYFSISIITASIATPEVPRHI